MTTSELRSGVHVTEVQKVPLSKSLILFGNLEFLLQKGRICVGLGFLPCLPEICRRWGLPEQLIKGVRGINGQQAFGIDMFMGVVFDMLDVLFGKGRRRCGTDVADLG